MITVKTDITDEKPIFVPKGLDCLWYTWGEKEKEVVLVFTDATGEELAMVYGFDTIKDCREYAMTIAQAAGLPKDCIDGDTWDVDPEPPRLRLVTT